MNCTITQERLFDEWSKRQGQAGDLALFLGITPAELADLTDNPAFAKRVAAWEAITRAYREGVVFEHQNAAAIKLRQAMNSADPVEARRITTVMARLCKDMLTLAASGTAPGGTALQSGASRATPAPKSTDQSTATPNPSHSLTPSSLHPDAPSSPHSIPTSPLTPTKPPLTQVVDIQTLELLALKEQEPIQVITKLAALATAAGTCQIPAPQARASSS